MKTGYTDKQKKYIDSVDGQAHMSAVKIIGELEEALEKIAKVGGNGSAWRRIAEKALKDL